MSKKRNRRLRQFEHIFPVLRPTAFELHELGYHDMTFAKKDAEDPTGRHKHLYVLTMASGRRTRVRIKLYLTPDQKHGRLEIEGSLMVEGRGNTPFTKINTIDGMWRFARMDGLCWCGKHPFTEEAAQENLRNALLRRVLMNQSRRRETRYYRCNHWGGVYHLTSQETYAAVPQQIEES